MKATELRIGSIIRFTPDKSEFTIDESIQELDDGLYEGFYIDSINICNFEPIPLTEEWLIKFGFDINRLEVGCLKVSSYKTYEEKELEIWNTDNGIELMINNEPNDICLFFSLKNIKYVHQLQNLYFALTGLELSIKE